uniref:Uncharacterized protein n=1 Tax=Ascaris lumbricoides TaxID=6252 RepID=A0A0M3I320_ASCLU
MRLGRSVILRHPRIVRCCRRSLEPSNNNSRTEVLRDISRLSRRLMRIISKIKARLSMWMRTRVIICVCIAVRVAITATTCASTTVAVRVRTSTATEPAFTASTRITPSCILVTNPLVGSYLLLLLLTNFPRRRIPRPRPPTPATISLETHRPSSLITSPVAILLDGLLRCRFSLDLVFTTGCPYSLVGQHLRIVCGPVDRGLRNSVIRTHLRRERDWRRRIADYSHHLRMHYVVLESKFSVCCLRYITRR